jgi:hypothetical protein
MSVELDNVSAIQKEVNTFLPPLRIFTVNPLKQVVSAQCSVLSKTNPKVAIRISLATGH